MVFGLLEAGSILFILFWSVCCLYVQLCRCVYLKGLSVCSFPYLYVSLSLFPSPQPGEGGKETVLANFFNSLLAKGKTGSSKPPTKDAAAEYDKMSAKSDRRTQQ